MTNEELVALIRAGDGIAVEELYRQNQGFLYQQARQLTRRYHLIRELKEEGFLAMLDAVEKFDPSLGNTFLTYAGHAVQAAMRDYLSETSTIHFPKGRYHQLRRVAYLTARTKRERMEKENDLTEREELVQVICKEMKLSEAVAERLLTEYTALYRGTKYNGELDREVCEGNFFLAPERVYESDLREMYLDKVLEGLSPREWNLISYHLGIGQPSEEQMTFQDLAIRLNYNSPSSAEKAFQRTVKKIWKKLLESEYGEYLAAKRLLAQAQKDVGH